MSDLTDIHRGSLTQPISPWFSVHQLLGIRPIDHLFNRLDGAYPGKWRSMFPSPESIRNWSESWVETFEENGIDFEMVKVGLKVVRSKYEWPPSVTEFVKACKPSIDPLKAYYEAVEGMRRRDAGEMGIWSSPAVFWAAVEVSAFDLKSMTYSAIRGRWEKSLDFQVSRNEWESIPVPMIAIPYEPKKLTKEEATQRLKELNAAGAFAEKGDAKDWARRIMAKPKNYPATSKKFAEEALGICA